MAGYGVIRRAIDVCKKLWRAAAVSVPWARDRMGHLGKADPSSLRNADPKFNDNSLRIMFAFTRSSVSIDFMAPFVLE
jgi:hypothetical protein